MTGVERECTGEEFDGEREIGLGEEGVSLVYQRSAFIVHPLRPMTYGLDDGRLELQTHQRDRQ